MIRFRHRHLAGSCNFGNLHDEMIRDHLVLGCRNKGARARLFREKDCTLQKALESLQISEATQEQLKDIRRWRRQTHQRPCSEHRQG